MLSKPNQNNKIKLKIRLNEKNHLLFSLKFKVI